MGGPRARPPLAAEAVSSRINCAYTRVPARPDITSCRFRVCVGHAAISRNSVLAVLTLMPAVSIPRLTSITTRYSYPTEIRPTVIDHCGMGF